MKAILEFDLDDHEDKMSHKRCVASLDMGIALWGIIHKSWQDVDTVDELMESITNICSENGIDIDNLIE